MLQINHIVWEVWLLDELANSVCGQDTTEGCGLSDTIASEAVSAAAIDERTTVQHR